MSPILLQVTAQPCPHDLVRDSLRGSFSEVLGLRLVEKVAFIKLYEPGTSVIYPCGDKLKDGISPRSESPVSDFVFDHTCKKKAKNICCQYLEVPLVRAENTVKTTQLF